MEPAITKAQVAKIWACARELGLDRETLYLLVPRGSISALSQREASELIERLEALAAKRVRRPAQESVPAPVSEPNAATQEQRNFIYFLLGRLGWLDNPQRVRGFLQKFAHVSSVEEIPDRKRASAIIEALKAIHKRQKGARLV